MTARTWEPTDPHRETLEPGRVHVWRVWLDEPGEAARAAILAPDERERAARFHFESDRRRFVRARAVLRELVGLYQDVPPEQVAFRIGPWGKPALEGRTGEALRFNVSHSHGLALFAFSRDRELGVDVELMRGLDDADRLADEFFSAREVAALRCLPESRRRRAFFECWTRKEAYVKATGDGLAAGLDRFAVSLGEAARLEWVDGDPEAPARWWLAALHPDPRFAAAIAVKGGAPASLSTLAPAPGARVEPHTASRRQHPAADGFLR